jgi:hypothetical protein
MSKVKLRPGRGITESRMTSMHAYFAEETPYGGIYDSNLAKHKELTTSVCEYPIHLENIESIDL